ncbi:MAG: DNA polymerase III subunit chi [Gammaproteobacteria bacterium]|jgi:DNA polymerase-3 subunit chi|nr:DNA polymerase III subunit chi [Gammaproteobacteria bacterium]
MTRVDFYLTHDIDPSLAVCRLTNKAFRLGHQLYILTENSEQSVTLDRLLWTFNPGSFIAHSLYNADLDQEVPVLIGEQEPPENWHDVLISLTLAIPSFFSRFGRVADVVGAAEEAKQQARERFRFYRERGYSLQTHNL